MSLIPSLASFGPWILVGLAIVSILVAYGVYLDAQARKQKNPESLKILSPEVWGLLCLFGSIPALALYWVAHYSTLAK